MSVTSYSRSFLTQSSRAGREGKGESLEIEISRNGPIMLRIKEAVQNSIHITRFKVHDKPQCVSQFE